MIINKTKKKVISKKETVCKSVFSQWRGLMFRRRQNLVMIFNNERKVSLHNFFVLYPVDVILLDKNNKIVEIRRNFNPFTFFNPQHKAKYIIELAFCSKYDVNDKLELKV